MSSLLLQSVAVATPTTRLRRCNPSGVSSPHQATHFPTRKAQNGCDPKNRIRCSSSRVFLSRDYGGPVEGDAASAAASFFGGSDLAEEDEDEDEEEEESDYEEEDDPESSLDLLMRFLQSMYGKVARRAKRASRSVLPPAIPPHLVSFAVDGFLLLASLSVVKALLQVACTLGGTVFAVILLVRVIWATSSYFQSNGGSFNQAGSTFSTGRPAI